MVLIRDLIRKQTHTAVLRFWHKNNLKRGKISNVVAGKVRVEKYILAGISGVSVLDHNHSAGRL